MHTKHDNVTSRGIASVALHSCIAIASDAVLCTPKAQTGNALRRASERLHCELCRHAIMAALNLSMAGSELWTSCMLDSILKARVVTTVPSYPSNSMAGRQRELLLPIQS